MLAQISRIFLLAALALAGWAVCQLLLTPARFDVADRALAVDWPEQGLRDMGIGPHEITVRVTNPAGHTRRLIGMAQGCRPGVCFSCKSSPIDVSAGGTVAFVCELDITQAGPFEFPFVLYYSDNGIREFEQTVRGTAVAREGQSNDPAPLAGQ